MGPLAIEQCLLLCMTASLPLSLTNYPSERYHDGGDYATSRMDTCPFCKQTAHIVAKRPDISSQAVLVWVYLVDCVHADTAGVTPASLVVVTIIVAVIAVGPLLGPACVQDLSGRQPKLPCLLWLTSMIDSSRAHLSPAEAFITG